MSEKCVHEWYYRIVDIVSWQFFCIRCGEKLSMDKFSDRATELEKNVDALNTRIAELESENGRLQESWLWETVCPDGSLRPKVSELLLNLDGWKERSNGWESIVETLNTRIAELESAQRWIPVSERLPEVDQEVLVFDQRGDITIDYLVALNREGVAYYTNSDDGAVCWMPLPQPPEVQQ